MRLHTTVVVLATTSLLAAQDAGVRAYGTNPPHQVNGPARLFMPRMAHLGRQLRLAMDYETPRSDSASLLFGLGPAQIPLLGVDILLDPSQIVADRPFLTRFDGTDTFDVFVPNDPSILGTFRAQILILDQAVPGSPFGVVASDGIEITIGVQDPPQTGQLVITEIMKNPVAVRDFHGEWVEVYNPGPRSIDIEGWLLHDESIDGVFLHNGGQGIVVPAGGYRVLCVNANPTTNGGIPNAFGWGYDDFQLGNTDDFVILARPDGTRVDVVRYDNGQTFPNPSGASLSLCPGYLNAIDNDDPAHWVVATSVYGAGDRGTPGAPNDSCPTITTLR